MSEKYRMLEDGEIVEPGDEALRQDGTWGQIAFHGKWKWEGGWARDIGPIRRPVRKEKDES